MDVLKDISVDTVKLDTMIISQSVRDDRAAIILSSIVQIAQVLGQSVIGEGVETKEQEEFLRSLDCMNI